ncbi:MAG: molecular chaperone HtpG [Candidatus Cloacimonadota bacterium]|nr:molecular chaperone HtpG [Candidatus Cloacimonadota bacterium]
MAKENKVKKGQLDIHSENIFPIIKKWLYSEHDIFIRELVSNSMDAMEKRKHEDENVKVEDLKVEIKVDKKKKTIQVIDTGIGMTEEEIKKYINQIAFSGAEDFVEKYKDKQDNMIGHFGLGFYSSFMVADKVEIDSLSWKEASQPAGWQCDGSTEYEMVKSKKKEVGTVVTVHVSEENENYLEESKIKEIVEKFCNFLPYPIMLGKDQLNQTTALWNKKHSEVKEEEYNEFYKNLFHEYQDPLFSIHLNVDFPFNLKGILYFPKIKNDLDVKKGAVKLYCRNVFVSDNLKQIIPEFLLLLRGGIDIPDIPLNVSRSFLQEDEKVKKINKYIIKKVSDHFKKVFKSDRKKYEEYWKDINNFIKYGILTEEKFYDAMKDVIIFKTTSDDYVSLDEYLERNKSEDKPQKIYYAADEDSQVSYIKLMKDQGIEVLYSESVLDSHLFQHLESKNSDISFVRVDSEVNKNIVDADDNEEKDENGQTISDKIKEIFTTNLNGEIKASFSKDDLKKYFKDNSEATEILSPLLDKDGDNSTVKPYEISIENRKKLGEKAFNDLIEKAYTEITIDIKKLKSQEISGMVVFNEQMRRFHEMNYLASNQEFSMLSNHTLMINKLNPVIQKIVKLFDANKNDEVKILCNYIHQLALLEQKKFDGKELKHFIENANKIMDLIKV